MSDPDIDLETFFDMKEVTTGARGATHVETAQAEHLVSYAEAQGFKNFKIEDWITQGLSDGVINEELAKKYRKLKVWGSYNIKKGPKKGQIGNYSGTTIFTAIKKSLEKKYFIALREASILIVPEEMFVKLKKAYKNHPKGKLVLQQLQTNHDFMYDRPKWDKTHSPVPT